jgi:hypothetical protein
MRALKIILVIVVILLALAAMGSLFFAYVPNNLKHVENPSELTPIPKLEPPPAHIEILKGIEEINARNAKIQSLYCREMDVIIQRGVGVRLRGQLAYEKDKKFRMKFHRRFRNILEADIGSNNLVFWFWSSQIEPPGLYYATHEDFLKTRLKKPFHPRSLMESLGINEIEVEGAELSEFEGKWKISKTRQTGSGTVVHTILVDPIRKRYLGSYVTTREGKLIASSEVTEWQGNVPKVITLNWYEENVVLKLKLNDPQVNTFISGDRWIMPDINPKINMGDD